MLFVTNSVFSLYSKYIINEVLEGCGDFKIERQVICIMKYAHDPVLLGKE
jgi:hypothetical protein